MPSGGGGETRRLQRQVKARCGCIGLGKAGVVRRQTGPHWTALLTRCGSLEIADGVGVRKVIVVDE